MTLCVVWCECTECCAKLCCLCSGRVSCDVMWWGWCVCVCGGGVGGGGVRVCVYARTYICVCA